MNEHEQVGICSQLRSKKWFFLKDVPRRASDLLDASNGCWCARTHCALGPDGWPVDVDDCAPERACFRAWPGAERARVEA